MGWSFKRKTSSRGLGALFSLWVWNKDRGFVRTVGFLFAEHAQEAALEHLTAVAKWQVWFEINGEKQWKI